MFLDDYAADGGLNQDDPDDPAPYRMLCGSEVGILIRADLNWQRYQATG